MKYEEFLKQVELRIRSQIGKEVRICIYPVTKNNSVVLDGMSILGEGENIAPAIYLNAYYKKYLEGETLDSIVSQILRLYQEGKRLPNLDTSFYTDFEQVKSRLVCRLVNWEKNKKLLEQVPHRHFLDLAIVYYYRMDPCELGAATILVKNEHMKIWETTEEEIHAVAWKNTPELLPYEFCSMSEMVCSIMELAEEEQLDIPLYILSNQEKSFGAVCMIYSNILEVIAERLQDDYYILPSSVHECMVIPARFDHNEQELQEMVKEINETQVEPEEVLADSVYRYDCGRKELLVALDS